MDPADALTAELSGVGPVPDDIPMSEVSQAADTAPTQRRGLFNLLGGNRNATIATGPDAMEVEPGTIMPFGEIARVCGVRRGQLGQEIVNVAGYRIYDTAPGATEPRIYYVTGFKDDCARTFVAAMVIEGDAAQPRIRPLPIRAGSTLFRGRQRL